MNTKPHILVCILSLTGNIRCESFGWRMYLDSKTNDPEHPFRYSMGFIYGANPALSAHNRAVEAFLKGDFDYMWIWADDMSPTASSLATTELLLEPYNADMACTSVYIWNSAENMPVLTSGMCIGDAQYEMGNVPRDEKPYEIDACGTGGLIISKKILTDPRMLISPAVEGDCDVLFRDQSWPSGGRRHGHDLDFTYRATQLGYSLWTHPGSWAEHWKKLGLLNLALYTDKAAYMTLEDHAAQWRQAAVDAGAKPAVIAALDDVWEKERRRRKEAMAEEEENIELDDETIVDVRKK